jgi:hypothetical protein
MTQNQVNSWQNPLRAKSSENTLSIFRIVSHVYAQGGLDCHLPTYSFCTAGITGVHHYTEIFSFTILRFFHSYTEIFSLVEMGVS